MERNNKDQGRISKKETKIIICGINKTKSWFFEKINNIGKSLVKLAKRKRKKTQINKIRDEKGDSTKITNEIQRSIREYFENLHSNKLENREEMGKYLDSYDLPKLNQEDINH
jgi:hypothetical protein